MKMERFSAFPPELARKYDGHGPRYTSYPTALQFGDFGPGQHRAAIGRSAAFAGAAPLSLYVHIPFCASPCFYCGCTKIISSRREPAAAYLDYLRREIELQGRLFARPAPVEQLHFGGGTPTFLTLPQLSSVLEALHDAFDLRGDAQREFSIEIDPRTIEAEALHGLAGLGFNRASFGIQDFDPEVQHAVNRRQSYAEVAGLMEAARSAGFESLSADLIYGLPKQTYRSFGRTLDQVIALRPDRISAYSYAHVPNRFKAQRQIRLDDLPNAAAKLELLQLTIARLLDAGYVYIGMDHFALPGDELSRALDEGSLQRNFQGYSTRGGTDLLGLGMSSISRISDIYSQNARTLPAYYAALDGGRLPVERGAALSADDLLRRDVIGAIMCSGRVDYTDVAARHQVDFRSYFADALAQLAAHARDGLVDLREDGLRVTPLGRYLLRAVAMPFDAYLRRAQDAAGTAPQYSRVI
ncbi:MAG TPA: oxygen-independent coproporphyrinogen III oxidase [Nevskia sp.]|nr:oxygen-independent coproporphyrinogen III oxidase [Nevskia sp.]